MRNEPGTSADENHICFVDSSPCYGYNRILFKRDILAFRRHILDQNVTLQVRAHPMTEAGCMSSRAYHLPRCEVFLMILSCPVSLETDRHVSFLENFRSHPGPGNQRFQITMGRSKIKFVNLFDYRV